jgi:hypothetical protein
LAEWEWLPTFAPRYESNAALKKDERFKAWDEVQAFWHHTVKLERKSRISNLTPSLKYGKTAVRDDVSIVSEGKQA